MKPRCENCKHHYPVPCLLQEDDPECPYVRCALNNRVHPKWDECDEWEDE